MGFLQVSRWADMLWVSRLVTASSICRRRRAVVSWWGHAWGHGRLLTSWGWHLSAIFCHEFYSGNQQFWLVKSDWAFWREKPLAVIACTPTDRQLLYQSSFVYSCIVGKLDNLIGATDQISPVYVSREVMLCWGHFRGPTEPMLSATTRPGRSWNSPNVYIALKEISVTLPAFTRDMINPPTNTKQADSASGCWRQGKGPRGVMIGNAKKTGFIGCIASALYVALWDCAPALAS